MVQEHRIPQQRFELKYLVPEEVTARMRDFIRCYLEIDEFGAGRPGNAYPVHSLYLDSDDLKLHHACLNGTRNRFKLRLRYYEDRPDAPVFFEIKGRADNSILKQRCGVRREAIPLLLAGQLPEPGHILSREPRHLATMQQFNLLLHQVGARPKLHNHYLREAWVSPESNSLRVNFDRQILVAPFARPEPVVQMVDPVRIFPDVVVLELKFTTRFPNWFRDFVRRFNLMQFSSTKYCQGVEMLGWHHFISGDFAQGWPVVAGHAFGRGAPAREVDVL